MPKQQKTSTPAPLIALVLAYLVPGAGHVYLGRRKRGIIIFVTITALFWSGVAVGGVMTVDSVRERWWFIAEMLTGVHGLVGWHRQRKVYENVLSGQAYDLRRQDDQDLLDAKLHEEGVALVAPAETVARAYAGIAGLLNLMCIFDALMLAIMGRTGEPPPPKPAAAVPKGART
ncbi:MAG TPA: DUF6677 family protein [Phycisphaerae bacterium]|nr:DUF6677 family protein [Phycisphaerae bacterium]